MTDLKKNRECGLCHFSNEEDKLIISKALTTVFEDFKHWTAEGSQHFWETSINLARHWHKNKGDVPHDQLQKIALGSPRRKGQSRNQVQAQEVWKVTTYNGIEIVNFFRELSAFVNEYRPDEPLTHRKCTPPGKLKLIYTFLYGLWIGSWLFRGKGDE